MQGLRTAAVVAVLLDHVVGWPRGGFIGVDVFFVVSGFLITGHLLRSVDQPVRRVLVDFYTKRVRRIVPSAVVVLLVGTGAAFLVFRPARAFTALQDAGWAAASAANVHFAAVGTDYFSAGGPESPFQHYWSLAVEEQFYLAWPLVLLLAAAVGRRLGRTRLAIGIVVAALTAASFAASLHQTATGPTAAYFSTPARGWELGAGALVAVAAPLLPRLPDRLRPLLAWVGLAGIVGAALSARASTGFPAPGALLPVLSTALVVLAGTGGAARGIGVLTNPVAVRVGDLSYVLYLWHLPVLVLLGDLLPPGPWVAPAVLAVTALLAVATHLQVEERFRRARRRARRTRIAVRRPDPVRSGFAGGAVTGFLAGAGLLAVTAAAAPPPPSTLVDAAPLPARVVAPATPPGPSASAAPSAGTALPRLRDGLRAALATERWPALQPDVPSVGAAARVPEWVRTGCLPVTERNLARCTWELPGATRTVAVVGDSIALSWVPAVRRALEPVGYRVVALTASACPAAELDVVNAGRTAGFTATCRAHQRWTERMVAAMRPDLVLASSSLGTTARLADGTKGLEGDERLREGQERFLAALRPSASRVVVLDPPPRGTGLQECQTRFSAPADCRRSVTDGYRAFSDATHEATEASGAAHVRTARWFCVDDRCPAFVDRTPVLQDEQHLTAVMSARLAPVLADALRSVGVPVDAA